MLIDFLVERCIFSEMFEGGSWRNVGGHVVYIEKEEEKAKNSPLWDSRAHVYLTRIAPFYEHLLCSIGQTMFNPELAQIA